MTESINSVADKWFAFQWAMLWQVAVLVAIVWLIDLAIRKWAWPQVRYALWMLVMIKLLLPPSLTSPVSVTSQIPAAAQKVVSVDFNAPEPVSAEQPVIEPKVEAPVSDEVKNAEKEFQTNGWVHMPAFPADTVLHVKPALSWKAWAMSGWLAGIAVLTAWLTVRLRTLRKQHASPKRYQVLHDNIQFEVLLKSAAQRLNLRRLPEVIFTERVSTPAVFGIIRPVLLMPPQKIRLMDARDLEHVLLHELAHIKRGDLWVHAVYMMLQIAYWFNPLLWLIRKMLQNLRELCCDATVARLLKEDIVHYRQMLLETALELLTQPVTPGLGLLGLFENNNWLVTRLQWLEKKTWKNSPLRIATVIALVSVMAVCVLPMGIFDPGEPKFVIKGTVTDIETGQPVARAKVGDIKRYNEGKFFTVSDPEGRYDYKTWYEEHAITAEAEGYRTQTIGFNTKLLRSEKERVIDVQLVPLTAVTVDEVLQQAEIQARQLKHDYIGTEHLLLAIVDLGKGKGFEILNELGAGVDQIKQQVNDRVKAGDSLGQKKRLPLLLRAKKALQAAEQEARSANKTTVMSEHILLGILRVPDSVGAKALRACDISYEQVQQVSTASLSSPINAEESRLPVQFVGHWQGKADIIVNWTNQRELAVDIEILPDGTVTGKVGDAELKNAVFKRNRNWLEEKLNFATDWMIHSNLVGPVIASENVQRDSINLLFDDLEDGQIKGGFHTSGSKFGGKETMTLSGSGMVLEKVQQLMRPLEFEVTQRDFLPGDSIEITQIRGTSAEFEIGQTYEVKGEYTLESHDAAVLHVYATDGETRSDQGPGITKRSGTFTRTLTLVKQGDLHLSFYPATGGESFGSIYFAGKSTIEKPAGPVDLTPAAFKMQLDPQRKTCSLIVSIKNESETVLPSHKIRFYQGDPVNNLDETGHPQNGSYGAGPIEPGKQWNERTRDFHVPDGEYTFTVVLDYDNSIAETNEQNNIASLQVTIRDGQIVQQANIAAAEPQPESWRFEGVFELDKDIAVNLVAGTSEQADIVKVNSIRFKRQGEQILQKIDAWIRPWPHTDWRFRIELLDEQGKVLGSLRYNMHNRGLSETDTTNEFEPIINDFAPIGPHGLITTNKPVKFTFSIVQKKLETESTTGGQDSAQFLKPAVQANLGQESEVPFCVYGRVTDAEGKPMSGVTVRANCGWATLMPTGSTESDEQGNYRLHFGPGRRYKIAETDEWGVGFQAASIFAEKAGFYETNLCQGGNLAMAGSEKQATEHPYRQNFKGVVYPNQPYELNFTMAPAASIKGLVTDVAGKPLTAFQFYMTGQDLYPSSSALVNITTDEKGEFSVASVPPKQYRFEHREGNDTVAGDWITYTPVVYNVRIAYDQIQKQLIEHHSVSDDAQSVELQQTEIKTAAQQLFENIKNADYEAILQDYKDDAWQNDGWRKLLPHDYGYMTKTDFPALAKWICETFRTNPIKDIEVGKVFVTDIEILGQTGRPAVSYILRLEDGSVIMGCLPFRRIVASGGEVWQSMFGIDWHLREKPILDKSFDTQDDEFWTFGIFKPLVQAGALVKMLTLNEQDLVNGLKFCAELSDGKYPVSLDQAAINEDLQRWVIQKYGETGFDSKTKHWLRSELLKVFYMSAYFKKLQDEGRSPEYFGSYVKPGYSAQILLQWKKSDNEFRVIYGDLHAETAETKVRNQTLDEGFAAIQKR